MTRERTELEELQFDCKLKVSNVKAAADTALNSGFDDDWVIKNYLSCIKESEVSVKKLLDYIAGGVQLNDNT